MKKENRTMKSILLKWLFLIVMLLIVGAFGYLAVVDVPIAQTPVEKIIPNDRFTG